MTIISPRTPRRSGSTSRAASPRQSTTISASAAFGSSRRRSGWQRRDPSGSRPVTRSARRGSRWASSGKNSARRKRPARSGSSAAMRVRIAPFEALGALGKARRGPAPRATGASTRLPFRTVPGKRSVHQAIDGAPHVTTSGSVVARSHHGASMPPAIHEQLPSPSARPRSTISTATPRSASSRAQARPATPAPMTMTEDLANR